MFEFFAIIRLILLYKGGDILHKFALEFGNRVRSQKIYCIKGAITSVKFSKTGIISAQGSTDSVSLIFINEKGDELTDERGNTFISGNMIEDQWGNVHGFIEGSNIMSVFSSTIVANEFIEW